jgi:hypothetical protein
LDTGYFPANAGGAVDRDPLFILGRVQVDIPASLVAFVVASDMLYMACSNDVLIQINLKNPEKMVKIPVKASIYKLFLDPSGRHLIIGTAQGDNLYLYSKWRELVPKPVKSLKMVIESVAWNAPYLLSSAGDASTGTRELLIGGRNGTIYEAVLESKEEFLKQHDRNVNAVFTLPERQPITGLCFQWFPPSDLKRGLVIVTTPTRIYQFVGPAPDRRSDEGSRMFTSLFSAYKGVIPSRLIFHYPLSLTQFSYRVSRSSGIRPLGTARSIFAQFLSNYLCGMANGPRDILWSDQLWLGIFSRRSDRFGTTDSIPIGCDYSILPQVSI